MTRILVLNGPNLNLLGDREPEHYGTATLTEIMDDLRSRAQAAGAELDHLQSDAEHELLARIHAAREDGTHAMIVNAGGLTHSSVVLRDALAAAGIPFIEVHLSNVFRREGFRHESLLSDLARGTIGGLGPIVYRLALTALLESGLSNKRDRERG